MKTKNVNMFGLLSGYRRAQYGLVVLGLLTTILAAVFNTGQASAAQFTKAFVRLDSLKALDTGVPGRVCFQPTVTTAIKSVQVTFPTSSGTDYSLNTTASNWAIDTNNLDSGQNAATNIGTAATTVSGHNLNIDFTGAGLTPSTSNLYCFNWSGTTTLTDPSAGGSETSPGTITTFSATGESGTLNSTQFSEPQTVAGGDTVAVSATVPPSFTFSLNGTTDGFASNLSTASVNTSNGALKAIITTNAASGWIVWAKDQQQAGNTCTKGALWSPTKLYCISSSAAPNSAPFLVATGAENYAFSVNNRNTGTAGTCTLVNVASYNYDGITTPGDGGVLSNSLYNPIASCNGTSTSSNVFFQELVTITGATPAGNDYADTIYLTGAGEF